MGENYCTLCLHFTGVDLFHLAIALLKSDKKWYKNNKQTTKSSRKKIISIYRDCLLQCWYLFLGNQIKSIAIVWIYFSFKILQYWSYFYSPNFYLIFVLLYKLFSQFVFEFTFHKILWRQLRHVVESREGSFYNSFSDLSWVSKSVEVEISIDDSKRNSSIINFP